LSVDPWLALRSSGRSEPTATLRTTHAPVARCGQGEAFMSGPASPGASQTQHARTRHPSHRMSAAPTNADMATTAQRVHRARSSSPANAADARWRGARTLGRMALVRAICIARPHGACRARPHGALCARPCPVHCMGAKARCTPSVCDRLQSTCCVVCTLPVFRLANQHCSTVQGHSL
jgi:hypothetical protein